MLAAVELVSIGLLRLGREYGVSLFVQCEIARVARGGGLGNLVLCGFFTLAWNISTVSKRSAVLEELGRGYIPKSVILYFFKKNIG